MERTYGQHPFATLLLNLLRKFDQLTFLKVKKTNVKISLLFSFFFVSFLLLHHAYLKNHAVYVNILHDERMLCYWRCSFSDVCELQLVSHGPIKLKVSTHIMIPFKHFCGLLHVCVFLISFISHVNDDCACAYKLREDFLQNFISSMDGPVKGSYRNKTGMKEHKKTTPLQNIGSSCLVFFSYHHSVVGWVVFLCVFIFAFVSVLFAGSSLLEMNLCKKIFARRMKGDLPQTIYQVLRIDQLVYYWRYYFSV